MKTYVNISTKAGKVKECEFLIKTDENDQCFISANTEKLGSLLEDSDAFDGAINGLEKMDSYLNWFSFISSQAALYKFLIEGVKRWIVSNESLAHSSSKPSAYFQK